MRKNEIKISSIKDQIYHILKSEIINGTLKSGEKLVELNIAARFNVSRSPVREAIKQLVGDGLVENVTNRGACVKLPTPKEVQDMQIVRTIFEEYAIREAAEHLTDQGRHTLEKLRADFLCTLESGDYQKYQALERTLSIEIIRMCNNSVIENDYIKVYTMMNHFSNSVMSSQQAKFAETVQERIDLIDALLQGDSEQALAAVHKHAIQASQYIKTLVNDYSQS